jgi:hypothetical protein
MSKAKTKPKAKLLYLKLFHGRADRKQQMDDWGSDGPVFGPYEYIHTTYGREVKMGPGTEGGDVDLLLVDEGTIYYAGIEYGDWSVFAAPLLDDSTKKRLEPFDAKKCTSNEWIRNLPEKGK